MTDRRISRWAIAAIAATLALAAASTWIVKVFGPRAVNPDYFCNCSVLELWTAMAAWAFAAVGCVLAALRLRRTTGANRAIGVIVGVASFALPVATVLVVRFVPFPTIEQLNGWAAALL